MALVREMLSGDTSAAFYNVKHFDVMHTGPHMKPVLVRCGIATSVLVVVTTS